MEIDELRELFLDMGHTKLNEMEHFDEWVDEQYKKFDQNKVNINYDRMG